jgi:hypothetical protein
MQASGGLYAFLTALHPIPHGALTRRRAMIRSATIRGTRMSDLLYLALGLAGFVLFALAIRAAERM